MNVGELEPVLRGVEQPAERPLERVGWSAAFERVGLEQQRQAGKRALLRPAPWRG